VRLDATLKDLTPAADAEHRLLSLVGLPHEDLFRTKNEILNDAYQQQGERIAYCEPKSTQSTTTA
jgi:hypothetical protein